MTQTETTETMWAPAPYAGPAVLTAAAFGAALFRVLDHTATVGEPGMVEMLECVRLSAAGGWLYACGTDGNTLAVARVPLHEVLPERAGWTLDLSPLAVREILAQYGPGVLRAASDRLEAAREAYDAAPRESDAEGVASVAMERAEKDLTRTREALMGRVEVYPDEYDYLTVRTAGDWDNWPTHRFDKRPDWRGMLEQVLAGEPLRQVEHYSSRLLARWSSANVPGAIDLPGDIYGESMPLALWGTVALREPYKNRALVITCGRDFIGLHAPIALHEDYAAPQQWTQVRDSWSAGVERVERAWAFHHGDGGQVTR